MEEQRDNGKVWGRKEWLIMVKWFDQIEDVRVGFRAISKNRSVIGMRGRWWDSGLAFGHANLGSQVRSPIICFPLFII